MQIKRSLIAPLIVGAIALGTGGWFLQRGAAPQQNVYMQARLFEEVVHHVQSDFVDEKPPSDLYRMAIDGMLHELGDPHTVFMTPDDYQQLRIQTQGEYGGLGIQINVRDGWVTVIAPLPGTPGERAGLRSGDRIIEVEGKSTHGWSTDDAVARLRGKPGEGVDMQVARVGVDDPIPFHIVREEIHVKSVPTAYMLGNGIGYMELTVFSQTSTDEIREAIAKLKSQGMKSLVVDLRRNPGGLLDQGVSVSDLFLDKKKPVVETHGRLANMNQSFVASTADQYPDLPIVLLVGPFSASASEIFSGALQDHDRALVIGQTTYGKGSVQTIYQLSGGNVLKLTTGRWYTPSGRSIQKPFDSDKPDALIANASVRDDTSDVARDDSLPKETFHTDMGRIVYGGGGIRPDIIVKDTVTQAERALGQAAEKYGSKFYDALFAFAVKYAHDHPALKRGFELEPGVLDDFYSALEQKGVSVDRSVYEAASGSVERAIGLEVARDKWGEPGRRERLNAQDPQVRMAISVLRDATTPTSVFAIADRVRGTLNTAGAPGGEQGGTR